MTATLTRRTSPLAFRSTGDGRTLRGWAVRYNVVDTYGTAFAPGVFDASLRSTLPVLVWAHDWTRPVGRVTEYTPGDRSGLPIVARFDDPGEVPDARSAIAQVRSGTVRALSVGFVPDEDGIERRTIDGASVVVFTRATLHEVSLVIAPAVPGSDVTDLRRPSLAASDPALDHDVRHALDIVARRAGPSLDDADVAQALARVRSRGL